MIGRRCIKHKFYWYYEHYCFLLSWQVPLPVVNGIVAFILALIPYMGAILSVIAPAMLALLD